MQSFLQKHTRHICQFVDCRLMDDLESELITHIEQLPPPRIAVVNSPTLALGQVSAVLEIVKRHFPAIRTVLCGEYPSAYPDHVGDLPRADFALSGDPEPILRNLLDYLDVEQRLRRTPGLIMKDTVKPAPHWLPRLNSLPLPDWDGIYWGEYTVGTVRPTCRAAIRLTRGHSKLPEDRAWGGAAEPLRIWPMDRMASMLSRSSHTEVNEVVLTDSPGFWTQETLARWVNELLRIRNAQPWSLSLHPSPLSADLIGDMRETHCRHVDMIFPSCDRDVMDRFNLRLDWRGLGETLRVFAERGTQIFPRFWIGGPDEPKGEAERIVQVIRRFGFTDYLIEPFPYSLNSPVYEEQLEAGAEPALPAWIKWSRDPWIMEQPMPLWGGRPGLDELHGTLREVQRFLQRSPSLVWARMQKTLRSRNWIELLEDKAIDFLQKKRRASH